MDSSAFEDLNLYETLQIPATSSAAEIRSAYRRLALQHHPDKAPLSQREVAHTHFQHIAFAYAVLSDEKRRARYDRTGSTKESTLDDDDGTFDWAEFFKGQYKEVSADAVKEFKESYQGGVYRGWEAKSPVESMLTTVAGTGSEEEKKDVLKAYEEGEGSLDHVFDEVMCSNPLDDEERFRQIIDAAIEAEEVGAFAAYTKETKANKARRKKAAQQEAQEAEEYAKELGVHEAIFGNRGDGEAKKGGKKSKAKKEDDTAGLAALIKSRNASRMDDLVASLEAKYGGKRSTRKGKKRTAADEPDEEAFRKTRANLEAKASKRTKKTQS